jgi:hypothetical protein
MITSDAAKGKAESGQRKYLRVVSTLPPRPRLWHRDTSAPENGRRFRFLKARLDKPEQNSKSEARNSKQLQMFKRDNDENWLGRDLIGLFFVSFILSFGFVSDFVLRIFNAACYLNSNCLHFA